MTLNIEERNAVIEYRIEKSLLTLKEAKDNAALGYWSLTANRLYYSAFYLILALIIKDGDQAKTHNGAFDIFSRKYSSTGLISKEDGSLYRRLFTMRQSGDYDDLFDWESEDVLPLIPLVENFITTLLSIIRS